MPSYKAPVRDARFIINQVLDIGSRSDLPGFGAASPDLVATVLEESGKFAAEVVAPLVAGDSFIEPRSLCSWNRQERKAASWRPVDFGDGLWLSCNKPSLPLS